MAYLDYLAYGSNLHPLRLGERVPSASLVGTVKLPGYAVVFHKRGSDGSAKCNLLHTGVARDCAYGAVYRLAREEKGKLDRFEGKGYRDAGIDIPFGGQGIRCVTYVAEPDYVDESLKPFHWYKQLVLIGAGFQRLPGDYVQTLEAVPSVEDPDLVSRREHAALIDRIKGYEGESPQPPFPAT
jgi:hypothetical protein